MQIKHTIKPIYNSESKILILGTMPSVKSREIGFYYSHPQNRFWKVLTQILNQKEPKTNEEKEKFLLKNKIALWDVLESCNIKGSSDSSITNPKPNNIKELISKTNIKTVFVTGKKAENLYNKLCKKQTNIPCIYLPSTSPANCACSYEKLKEQYKIITKFL